LVKVHAVSINDWDWADLGRITKGHWLARLQFGWSKPKKIVGSDVAGRVESVGRDVKQFKPGDAVFGDLSRYFGGFGGFAEYVCGSRRNQTADLPSCANSSKPASSSRASINSTILQTIIRAGCNSVRSERSSGTDFHPDNEDI
jgi:NADPH:quinone reductase-like Zn-dependent oxidoreductase